MGDGKVYVFRVSIKEETPGQDLQQAFYNLKVNDDGLTLCDFELDTTILHWSFKNIRRFAKTSTTFIIEAGRRSESGDGSFTFITSESEKIMDRFTEKTNNISQGKKQNEVKTSKPLPPLPREDEDYTEPYCWVSPHEKKVQRSHTYTEAETSQNMEKRKIKRSNTYTNASIAKSDEKEFVVIDHGTVRIEAKDKCPSPCEQRYTPMLAGQQNVKSDSHCYTELATTDIDDDANYITPVNDSSTRH